MATRNHLTPKNRSKSAPVSDEGLDKILRAFDAQPAHLTVKQMEEIEAWFTGLDSGRCRRTALATLTRSGRQLVQSVSDQEGAAAFVEAQELVLDYSKRLREFADRMAVASARIGIALCSAAPAEVDRV